MKAGLNAIKREPRREIPIPGTSSTKPSGFGIILEELEYMIWLLGIALTIVFWFIFPPFRKFILVVGGLFVLLIVGLILNSNYQESASKSLIPTSQIQLTNLRLVNDNIGEKELYGEVRNNSDKELLDVYLKITAYDCPESSITPSCTTIGQDDSVSAVSGIIPPHQVRVISGAFVSFYNMPSVKGNFLWSYEITGTRGR